MKTPLHSYQGRSMNAAAPGLFFQSVRPLSSSPFLRAGRLVLEDLLSTFLFVGLLGLTRSVLIALLTAVTLGLGQIVYRRVRGRGVELIECLSLGLVVVLGGASLFTRDPRFVMLKPTFIYFALGCAMMKRGWMVRYAPPKAQDAVKVVTTRFGYVWAGMMFVTAAINLVLVVEGRVQVWALFLAIFPPASKTALFFGQYLFTRALVVGRRATASSPMVNARQP